MLTSTGTDIVTNMECTARKWHEGQFRKDGKTPYIEHPKTVVEQLMAWGFTKESNPLVLAIAWGHDLGEDTNVPFQELMNAGGVFGPELIDGIMWLTFSRGRWPEAESREAAKEMYIANVAKSAPTDILAIKIADRLCNIRDFAKLCGERSEKVRSYYWEAEPLFDNIRRLPDPLRHAVSKTYEEVKELVFDNMYELRDAWVDEFYIVKEPPTAYGYIFEGRCKWDGDDFAAYMSLEELLAWKTKKKVPRYIAEAYAEGKIKPEEVDWDSDKPVS